MNKALNTGSIKLKKLTKATQKLFGAKASLYDSFYFYYVQVPSFSKLLLMEKQNYYTTNLSFVAKTHHLKFFTPYWIFSGF